MGIELARAFITIAADSSQVIPELKKLKNEVSNLMQEISVGALAVLAPFTMFTKHMIEEGVKGASFIEDVTIELTTMLGSAEECRKTLERLTKFSIETPFEMPELMNVTKGLVMFGKKGDELMNTLKMLGDSASGNAAKFNILAMVYEHVMGVGSLHMRHFQQLSMRGVISLKDISKYFKITDKAASDMLENGLIKFEDFHKILEANTKEGGRFADAMKKASTSFAGLKSTLNDCIHFLNVFIAQPLMPWIKRVLQALIVLTTELGNFIKATGNMVPFAIVMATAFGAVATAIFGVVTACTLLGVTLSMFLTGGGIAIAILAIGAALGALIAYFRVLERASAVWDFIYKEITQIGGLLDHVKSAMDNLAVAFEIAGDIFMRMFEAVFGGMAEWAKWFGIVEVGAKGTISTILLIISEFVADAAEWIQTFFEWWEEIWAGLPNILNGVFSYMIDIVRNSLTTIRDVVALAFESLLKIIYKFIEQTEIGINQLLRMIPLIEKVKTIKSDEDVRKFWEDEAERTSKGLGLKPKAPGSIFEMSDITKELLGANGLAEGLNRTKKNLEAIRNEKFKPKWQSDQTKAVKADVKSADWIKPGMTEIDHFGKTIQEHLLKQADPAAKTNDILEQSKGLQEKQLTVMEDINKNLGLA